eukprot:7008953-Karenia_brevis.AAC.1
MAQEFSFEVPEAHEPTPKVPLGKKMAAQGFVSDKTAWADATDQEEKNMEENLRPPEEIPQPFLESFP